MVWWWSTRRLTRRKQGWDEDDVSFAEMAFEDFCLILRCLWEERVFNREAWKGKYGGFDENGTVSYLGYVDL